MIHISRGLNAHVHKARSRTHACACTQQNPPRHLAPAATRSRVRTHAPAPARNCTVHIGQGRKALPAVPAGAPHSLFLFCPPILSPSLLSSLWDYFLSDSLRLITPPLAAGRALLSISVCRLDLHQCAAPASAHSHTRARTAFRHLSPRIPLLLPFARPGEIHCTA